MSSWGRVALPRRRCHNVMTTSLRHSGGRGRAGCNRRLFANPRHARSRAYQASSPAAFQRRVEPGECRHLELFGQVLDGGQRHLFVVVRESAFQLEELQRHGEAQSPLLRALLAKLLPVAAEAPELSEFATAPALFHPSRPPKRGSESSRMNDSEGEFGTSEQLCCNWAYPPGRAGPAPCHSRIRSQARPPRGRVCRGHCLGAHVAQAPPLGRSDGRP